MSQLQVPMVMLEEAIGECDESEDALRTDYSGRAMYERTCVGVVGDAGLGVAFALELLDVARTWQEQGFADGVDLLELKSVLARMSTDNMGMSTIFYWQGLEVADEG